jgi:hypothetical protein
MIEPEIVDSNSLPLHELPETVVLTGYSTAYHAQSADGGAACGVGDAANYNEHSRVGLRGHYRPCRSCFNWSAVADEMLYDDD